MKKLLTIIALLSLVNACATSQSIVLPSGQQGFTVNCGSYEGDSWSACYKKAGEVCPAGYDILEEREEKDKNVLANPYSFQTVPSDKRTLIIQCKEGS